MTRLLAGASGYSFKEWKGDFYPKDMKLEGMLPYYAERLPTVEINNTFYQMPKTSPRETGETFPPQASASHQGLASHHALRPAQARCGRRFSPVPVPQPRHAGRQARSGAFPAAAADEEGPA